jgi:uncharacterized protein YecE (DUF72 family)
VLTQPGRRTTDNSTFYALPSVDTATSWVQRTPARFLFNVKAISGVNTRDQSSIVALISSNVLTNFGASSHENGEVRSPLVRYRAGYSFNSVLLPL